MIKRTLYFGSSCYLSAKLNQLVISQAILKNDTAPSSIPIEDIGVLVLDNQQICITQGLIQQLIENNVAIIHCNFTHHPIGLVLPMEGNDVQSQRFRV
jgi:CRISPR-associated protein Cas1